MTSADIITEKLFEINGVTNPNKPFQRLTIYGDQIAGCFDIQDGTYYSSGFFFYDDLVNQMTIKAHNLPGGTTECIGVVNYGPSNFGYFYKKPSEVGVFTLIKFANVYLTSTTFEKYDFSNV